MHLYSGLAALAGCGKKKIGGRHERPVTGANEMSVGMSVCAIGRGRRGSPAAVLLIGSSLIVGAASPSVFAQRMPAAASVDQGGAAAKDGEATEQLSTVFVEAPRIVRGPGVSPTGANSYGITANDIDNLPSGGYTAITDVLAQLPGVAIDQNEQIHIRNTEGPQFQYQINGVMVPLDINTNPPFISMLNPLFIAKADLLDGILPSRYSYATGGVVDIQTKDGCNDPNGQFSILAGQRRTVEPSLQYAGCSGKLSYYFSVVYQQSNTAFNSATPDANGIHDETHRGQTFGYFSYPLSDTTKLSLITSAAASNNELPNVPGLDPEFTLAGVNSFSSAAIDSHLNFQDYFGIVTLSGTPSPDLSYQIAYAAHSISQVFNPDQVGELIYQGVASTASHNDLDNTLQGDLHFKTGNHTFSTGFYLGEYRVIAEDSSLVFPVDDNGNQTSTTPITIANNTHATNILSGIYVDDLWQVDDRLRLNLGVRWDDLTGFTNTNQFDPSFSLTFLLTPATTLHGGFARYMQVPSFQGISPDASTAFAGTSGEAGPPGTSTPLTENDWEWDGGVVHHLSRTLTVSQDAFFEKTKHYLDTGQFGVVPIFAPFNYIHGTIWGSETAITYHGESLSAYANLTIGRNSQQGVATGQFNFDPDELAFIDGSHIILDHQPQTGASAGVSYKLRPVTFNLDAVYSSGLRFAEDPKLPTVLQVNVGTQLSFHVPGIGEVIDRVTVLNLLDRTNLIRPAEGIGIFQSAYGPRMTWSDTLTIPF